MMENVVVDKSSPQIDEEEVDEFSQFLCGTTAGDFEFVLYRNWSPAGYDRAVQLFERGFYDHSHFFRVVPNFLAQFGIR